MLSCATSVSLVCIEGPSCVAYPYDAALGSRLEVLCKKKLWSWSCNDED